MELAVSHILHSKARPFVNWQKTFSKKLNIKKNCLYIYINHINNVINQFLESKYRTSFYHFFYF